MIPRQPGRVVIVDDHHRFRAAAGAILRSGGFDVVAEAATLGDALRAIEETRPDLIVLDVQLPDGDGIDGAVTIAALEHPPVVVLVSARQAAEFGGRLANAPARGFITKDELSVASLEALL